MTDQTGGTSRLYALLIGADHYFPNRLSDGGSFGRLNGCVRDVTHVEEFLRLKLGLSDTHLIKLTATNTGAENPPEPSEQWPTYENIIAAFQRLATLAQAGDQVYIHYSGHGGRTPTAWPDIKGPDGVDESLVPIDIGNPAARYLRDIELAHLLNTLVDKQFVVTLVLDSCHSGGATRSLEATKRGLDTIDTTVRPAESLVASHDELGTTWRSLTANGTRDVSAESGWLPADKQYICLAACRPSESAYEYPFNGTEKNGALTYWLLDSLQQLGPSLTYKLLHDRIIAKVHTQFDQQTPLLLGDTDRVVFGSDHVQPQYTVGVMQVDPGQKRVLIHAGQATGLRTKAQFAIYPPGAIDFAKPEQRLALAKIVELGATDSWAEITPLRDDPIVQGAQAVLINPGSVQLVRKVRLLERTDLPSTVDQKAALDAVRAALAGNGWVELAETNEDIAQYQVAVNDHGAYEIWDGAGEEKKNLKPPVPFGTPEAAAKIVQRLVHLSKYHATQQLDNNDPTSPLARKLIVELLGVQDEYDRVDKPAPQPFAGPGNAPILKVDQWTFLRIKNTSSSKLNVVVLDLQPDEGINQIYPRRGELFEEFDPGRELVLPLKAGLPEDYAEGVDVIKVFATVGAADFRWLQLPALDGRNATRDGRGPQNPLEELLGAIAADQPPTRDLNPGAYPTEEWATAQVEVRVQRQG